MIKLSKNHKGAFVCIIWKSCLIAQQLVDGLMGGYKDYLAERKQKQQCDYWCVCLDPGNFIDSKIMN